MRILFITNNPNLGSTARVLQVWAVRLMEMGYLCRVVCPPGKLSEDLQRAGVSVMNSSFPSPNRRRPWVVGWEALRVAAWARGTTVIHCNEHNVYPFAAIVSWLLRCPVVCHVRFNIARDFTTWAFGRFGAPNLLLWTSYYQRDENLKAVEGIIPVSRQRVVRLGLDTKRFGSRTHSRKTSRDELQVGDDSFVVGTASAIKPIKRLEDFIELVRRVREHYPNVIGVIAGGTARGHDEYELELKRVTTSLGGDSFVRWVGDVHDIEPFLHAIDLFVSSSELETFGNSVCEAMLCGKPVVAYHGGAVAEVVGDAGRIVRNFDLADLTNQALDLISHPHEAARLGAMGLKRVLSEFDAESRIPELVHLYEELLRRPLVKTGARARPKGEVCSPLISGTTASDANTASRQIERRSTRVLYLTINPNRVSTTVPTEGWFRQLRSAGLDPVLVSHEIGAFHEWAQKEGIPSYHESLPLPSKYHPWPFFLALLRLRSIVRRHDIQLIHCNEQNCYPIGSYLAKLTGLPIAVSVHFTMGRDFCQWAFGKHVPQRMYSVSEGNLRACEAGIRGIVPEERCFVLNNGLDLEHFQPDGFLRESHRSAMGLDGNPIIGVACALRARKQLEHLFEAARRLPPEVRIVVAGGPIAAEAQYGRELLEHGKQLLGNRLIALGHLDELRPFYNALDLFVNTSQEEACSISVLEALACGCPVVGYSSKTVDTQILPGGGEITPQDDVESLAAAIQRWLGDPERLAAARISSRKRVESAFDIRVIANDLMDDYRIVLSEFAAD